MTKVYQSYGNERGMAVSVTKRDGNISKVTTWFPGDNTSSRTVEF